MGTHYKGRAVEVRALDAYIKLLRATKSIQSRLERQLARERLTESQFGVLEALFHLGPQCGRALGEKLLMGGPNVTTVVDNLVKRALVRRLRDSADRRFVSVHLTPEGKRTVERALPPHVSELVLALSGLGRDELDQLGALCKKLGLSAVR